MVAKRRRLKAPYMVSGFNKLNRQEINPPCVMTINVMPTMQSSANRSKKSLSEGKDCNKRSLLTSIDNHTLDRIGVAKNTASKKQVLLLNNCWNRRVA